MDGPHNRRPSEWRRLFRIACDLIDQDHDRIGDYPFGWSFGGGTAMMIQIGHRESHDIDLFLDDAQILGFLDPAKTDLSFAEMPTSYLGDGSRFQKFAFEGVGEIDFIAAGSLTNLPFEIQGVEGRPVKLETIPEIIAKKIYYRGSEANARDVFDLAAAGRTHRQDVVDALREFPEQVGAAKARLDRLGSEFVAQTIAQLMILPDYLELAPHSLELAKEILGDALSTVPAGPQ